MFLSELLDALESWRGLQRRTLEGVCPSYFVTVALSGGRENFGDRRGRKKFVTRDEKSLILCAKSSLRLRKLQLWERGEQSRLNRLGRINLS